MKFGAYSREELNPRPLPTPSKRKVPKRYDVSKRAWRNRQVSNCRCGVCGKKMPENDLRKECPSCRHHHIIRNAYRKHFIKDFK
jgi:acetyl-CoA carboxylase beta subunit